MHLLLRVSSILVGALALPVSGAQKSVGLYELLGASLNHPSVQLSQNEEIVSGHRLDAAEWARYPSFITDASAPIGPDSSLTLVDAEVSSCANALRLQLLSNDNFVKEKRG